MFKKVRFVSDRGGSGEKTGFSPSNSSNGFCFTPTGISEFGLSFGDGSSINSPINGTNSFESNSSISGISKEIVIPLSQGEESGTFTHTNLYYVFLLEMGETIKILPPAWTFNQTEPSARTIVNLKLVKNDKSTAITTYNWNSNGSNPLFFVELTSFRRMKLNSP